MLKRLVRVDPDMNSNATFFIRKEGAKIVTEFSRTQGGRPIVTRYPYSQKTWDRLVEKHLSKGYTDISDEEGSDVTVFKKIADRAVREFADFITANSRKMVQENYVEQRFTRAMIGSAEALLKKAAEADDLEELNRYLVELFKVLSRKMDSVKDCLAGSLADKAGILEREDALLSAAKAEARYQEAEPDKTVLEALGLEVRPVTDSEYRKILEHIEPEVRDRCKRAFRVRNRETDARFEAFMEKNGYTKRDIHFRYHGTGKENLLGILTEGPKLHPDARITAKMFGFGFYTADKAMKSLRYMGIRVDGKAYNRDRNDKGYLLVYKVLYKNPLHVYRHRHEMCSYTKREIAPHDALFAHAGESLFNNEFIVYEEERVTVLYAIEVE